MSTSDVCKICKDGASSDDVRDVKDKLQNMSTADVSACANCGKEGANNTCNKCKMVKYCNAACKKKHRHKHKKQCERWVAKLQDEKLFKQPPDNLHHWKIAQFVSYECLHLTRVVHTSHAVGKLYVVDAFMHLFMITKAIKLIIKSVHFAELFLYFFLYFLRGRDTCHAVGK